MKNKLPYDTAELQIISITLSDILTTSGNYWDGALGGEDEKLTDPDGWT